MILALDTSTRLGSVAVASGDGEVRARRLLPRQRAHAEELVPAIAETLAGAGADRRDLAGVVVGAGPGSFTGVRVAAATAKGLVRALGISLRAFSSLEAGAVTAGLEIPDLGGPAVVPGDAGRPRHVLFDARGERVYAAAYRLGAGGIETLADPWAATVDDVLATGPGPDALFCGSGARRHRERIEEAGWRVLPEPAGIPTADALLRILALEPDRAPVADPARWEPAYVRPWAAGT